MRELDVLENSYTFDDYVNRIAGHIELAGDIPEFTDTLKRLKESRNGSATSYSSAEVKVKPATQHKGNKEYVRVYKGEVGHCDYGGG